MNRRIFYSIMAVIIVLLLAAIAIPNFARKRFTSSGEPLSFQVRVVAQEGGAPVQGAEVQIQTANGVTGADGCCQVVQSFPAKGIAGRSARCSLYGTFRVTAPGFRAWEKDLASLFGASYDYFNRGTQITHVVTLSKPSSSKGTTD
jgi:hypothetical protein